MNPAPMTPLQSYLASTFAECADAERQLAAARALAERAIAQDNTALACEAALEMRAAILTLVADAKLLCVVLSAPESHAARGADIPVAVLQ